MSSQLAGHGSKFPRKKEAAIQGLLTQRNLEEAARVAGISTQTLKRWLKLPEFQDEYLEVRRQLVSQSNARLQQACGTAVSVLMRTMVDANTPPATRLRAADLILSGGMRALKLEDTEVRLAALERALAARHNESAWPKAGRNGGWGARPEPSESREKVIKIA